MDVNYTLQELVEEGRYILALEVLHTEKNVVDKECGFDSLKSLLIQNAISKLLSKQGYYNEALSMFIHIEKKLAASGSTYDEEIVDVKGNIANAYVCKCEYNHALPIFEEIYKYQLHTFGKNNPLTFMALRNLAKAMSDSGKHDDALIILMDVHKFTSDNFGTEHNHTIQSLYDIATVRLEQCEYGEAMCNFQTVYEHLLQKRPDDWDTLLARCDIAKVYKRQFKYEEAFQIYGEVYLIQAKRKPDHPDTLSTLQNLAEIFEIRGEEKAALLLFNKIYSVRSVECPMHHDTIKVEKHIATILLKQEKHAEAIYFFNTMLSNISTVHGIQSHIALEIHDNVALEFFDHKIFNEALKIFKTVYHVRCKMCSFGPDHPSTLLTKINIGGTYLSLSNYDEAVDIFKEVLEILRGELGSNNPDCIAAQNNIAVIRSHQKKYDEAYELYYDLFQSQLISVGDEHQNTMEDKQNLDRFLNTIPKSSLDTAIINNDFTTVKFAVEIENLDVNAQDFNGFTPLHIASNKGHVNVIKYLFDKGVIYNIKNNYGETPFQVAANDEIKYLLKTVKKLFGAMKGENYDEIFQIIENDNSFINARDDVGNTLLHMASKKRSLKTVKFLLNRGADPTFVNKSGDTPLHSVASNFYKDIINVLLPHVARSSFILQCDFMQ